MSLSVNKLTLTDKASGGGEDPATFTCIDAHVDERPDTTFPHLQPPHHRDCDRDSFSFAIHSGVATLRCRDPRTGISTRRYIPSHRRRGRTRVRG